MNLEKYGAKGDSMEDFYAAEPDQIARQIESSLQEFFPLTSSNGTLQLRLERVWVDASKDDALVPGRISSFRYEGKSYSLPIMAEFILSEKKGQGFKEVNRTTTTIGPYFPIVPTLGTRLINGNLYQNKLQFRRQPGVYPHRNKAGDALVEFNTANGRSFSLGIDLQNKGEQTIDVRFMGKSRTVEPRAGYAILRALGKSDADIKKDWGDDVWAQNALDSDGQPLSEASLAALVDKAYKGFADVREKKGLEASGSLPEAARRLTERLKDAEGALDPEVVRQTIGVHSDHINGDVMMQASNSLLSVYGGEDPPHRFSERFRTIHSMSSQIKDAVSHRTFASKFVAGIQRKLDKASLSAQKPTISNILEGSRRSISEVIQRSFTNSDLSSTTETSNIADIEARSKEITIRGPGGIRNEHSITDETVSVHPSRLGLTGLVKTQVSAPGVVIPLAQSAVIDGDEVRRRVYDRKLNKIRTVTSEEVEDGGLAFPDEFIRTGNEYKPKGKTILAAMGDSVKETPEEKVRYVIVDQSDLFSSNVNATPFLGHNSGPRVIMGANQMTQAISLKNPEAPLVQSIAPDGESFDRKIGSKFNAKSPVKGVVKAVGNDSVTIESADGKEHVVSVLKDLPLNQGSFLDQSAVVSVGDKVKPGQIITSNNYTDADSTMAIGRNLHVGYMPMDGWNHEDGIVLSQQGADKLTSVHVKEFKVLIAENDKTGVHPYNNYLEKQGKKATPDNAAKLDSDGLIKKGAIVAPGDIIAAIVAFSGYQEEGDFSRSLRKIFSNLNLRWRDRSLYWEENHPGEVIRVVKTPTLWRIFIKTEAPFKVGDKLSNRFGAKGIVSKIYPNDEMPKVKRADGTLETLDMIMDPHGIPCFDPKTEMLTQRGWIAMPDIREDDIVSTLNQETFMFEWQKMEAYHTNFYQGPMYEIKNRQIDLCVTPNHKMFVAEHGGTKKFNAHEELSNPEARAKWSLQKASEIQGQRRRYLKAANWKETDFVDFVHIPSGYECGPARGFNFYPHHWAEFVGWYVTRGSCGESASYIGSYPIKLSLNKGTNPEHYKRVYNLMSDMGIRFEETSSGFTFSHKGLYETLKPLGKTAEERLTREVLDMPRESLRLCMEALIAGGGCVFSSQKTGHKNITTFATVSNKMAGDIQELAIKLGLVANICQYKNKLGQYYNKLTIQKKGQAPWVSWSEATKKIQHEGMIDYSGMVYCPTVPNGVVMVRRDGKAVWSGNSRANPGQVLELAAGKLAKETGEVYKVKNFEEGELEKLRQKLNDAGLSDKEVILDPSTGREIPNVATGYVYNAKLRHQLDKKFDVRHTFASDYDLNEQPISGAAIDKLTLYGLAGHNARAIMSEMARLKGTRNEEYWSELANGNQPARVQKSPFAFEKMKALMEGMGVSVKAKNDMLSMTPMTDSEVLRRSRGYAITDSTRSKVLKNFKPKAGGLWDPALVHETGWNHIDLPEPTPNPAFIKPIQLLLSNSKIEGVKVKKGDKFIRLSEIKQKDIRAIFTGEHTLEIDGKEVSGGEALKEALRRIDLKASIEANTERLKKEIGKDSLNANNANNLHQVVRYAKMLQEEGIRPEEAYMMTKIPVIPPEFRRPAEDSSGNMIESSVDKLYAEIINNANILKQRKEWGVDGEDLQKGREVVFDSFGALVGSGARNTSDFAAVGLLDQLASPKAVSGQKAFDLPDSKAKGPKNSFPQRKVVKKRMELSGRTTIIPDPGLDIDEAGIPEEAAWAMYEPFVRKRLSEEFRLTHPKTFSIESKTHFKERTPQALIALKSEMSRRPVLLNRAPSWWQYNIMAFKPKLIMNNEDDGEKALRIPAMVVAPYMGGDYDGDALNMHVPAEDEAVAEAYRMLPSHHLRSVGDKKLMIVPDQSMLIGLYHMTGWNKGSDVKKIDDFRDALRKNEIRLDQVIRISGKETTAGWELLDVAVKAATNGKVGIDTLIKEYGKAEKKSVSRRDFFFTKATMKPFLNMLLTAYPNDYVNIVQHLAKAGDREATRYGVSIGLSDLRPMDKEVGKITSSIDKLVPVLAKEIATSHGRSSANAKDTDSAIVSLYDDHDPVSVGGKNVASARVQIENHIGQANADSNQIIQMMQVGSKGNTTQIRQVLAAPLIVQDVQKNRVPVPIKRSFAGGLTTSDYFVQQHGTISGLRDRAVETSRPGDIGKQMLSSSAPLVVSIADCGTSAGENESTLDFNKGDIIDRVLAQSAGGVSAGTLITASLYAKLARSVKQVRMRSPLTCEAHEGICQKCFGLQPNGNFPAIGENVGVQQAQAIVEPLANAKLKSFHTSGAASGAASLIDRVDEIVNLKSPQGKAILISEKGTNKNDRFVITDIEKRIGASGTTGSIVKFRNEKGGMEHTVRVPPSKDIIVRVGTVLRSGDPITNGPVDPNELRSLRGFRAVQRYVSDELQQLIGVNKRSAETVTAAMSRMALITDPGDSDYTPHDTVPVGHIRTFNRQAKKENKKTIEFSPQILGVSVVPKQGEDWLPKLDFRNIKQQIISAATTGAKSPIHGPNPMSAYIFGREMDRGRDGNWHY